MKERAEDIKHAAEYIGQQAQPKIYSTALRKLRANGPERWQQYELNAFVVMIFYKYKEFE